MAVISNFCCWLLVAGCWLLVAGCWCGLVLGITTSGTSMWYYHEVKILVLVVVASTAGSAMSNDVYGSWNIGSHGIMDGTCWKNTGSPHGV